MPEHLRGERRGASRSEHEGYAEAERRLCPSIYAVTSKYQVYEYDEASLSVSFQ